MRQPNGSDDFKWLRHGASRRMRLFTLWHGPLLLLLLLAVIALHLYVAGMWAGIMGLSFRQVWHGWMVGISPGHTYSGVYLKALEQLDKCLLLVAYAVFVLVSWPMGIVVQRRKARLLAYIESLQLLAERETEPDAREWPPVPRR